jgi:hypothetical protein
VLSRLDVSRSLLAAAGVALAASLFLSWFGGVSGWEHFAWADVALAVVAAGLVAAALSLRAVLRALIVVLCGLGIAVVLGHGFAPDEPVSREGEIASVGAGGYVALAALAAGAIGALAAWPRRGAVVLLVAAAAGIVGALLSGWGGDAHYFTFAPGEAVFDATDYPTGFERWRVLDVALLALGAGLLAAATGRLPLFARAALAVAALAAAACVLVGIRDQLWVDEGAAIGAAKGPLVALLALGAGLVGLVCTRAGASPDNAN